MDTLALLGHPAAVAAIVAAIVAAALVLIRRRRRVPAPTPVPAPPPAPPDAAYLDSSHILEGPVVGDSAQPDRPHER